MSTENSSSSPHEINTFVFDLDGVIWRGNAPIEGAVESVAQLKEQGKRCLFCTNNSRRSPEEFAARLREIGIDAGDDEVMTSSMATVLYLESQFTGPFTAYVIGEEGLVAALRRTGAIITTSPIIPQRSDLNKMQGEMDCVVVGIDATFSYHKMRLAQRLILGGARFIATNRDSTFPTPHGIVPGAGAIVAAIETATGISPVVLGKPQPLMIQLLARKFDLKVEEIAFVGDRLDTDMTAAHRAGAQALFIATGVHTVEQASRAKGEQKPDDVYENLPALCAALAGSSAPQVDLNKPAFDGATTATVAAVTVAAVPVSAVPVAAVPVAAVPVAAVPVAATPIDDTAGAPLITAENISPAAETETQVETAPALETGKETPAEPAAQTSVQTAPSPFALKDDTTKEATVPQVETAKTETSQTETSQAAEAQAQATVSPFDFSFSDAAPLAEPAATSEAATSEETAPEDSLETVPEPPLESELETPEAETAEAPKAEGDNWWESLDKLI